MATNNDREGEALLLTPREAAALLRISPRKLWTLTKLGLIQVIKLGRSVRYAISDLKAYIEACRRPRPDGASG